MKETTNGIKSTILGIFFLCIAASIYVPIQFYNDDDFNFISSIVLCFFILTGVISLFGKDKLLNKLFEAIINIVNRFKK